MKSLVRTAKIACESYFPRERGYRVEAQSPAGAVNGVRLTVIRGDFRASVAIESLRPSRLRRRRESVIRMFGRAQSEALHSVELAKVRWILRSPVFSALVGACLFASVAWPLAGASGTTFLLPALMLVIVTALLTQLMGFGLIGVIGEWSSRAARSRAMAALQRNPFFDDDLRRWKSLTRQLNAHAVAIAASSSSGPFRCLPAVDREQSAEAPDASGTVTVSSFSFSS